MTVLTIYGWLSDNCLMLEAVATIKLPTLFLMKRWLKIKFAKRFPESLSVFSNSDICLGLIRKDRAGFYNVLKESSSWIFISETVSWAAYSFEKCTLHKHKHEKTRFTWMIQGLVH